MVVREHGFKWVAPNRLRRDFDFHASLRRCDPDQVQRVTCFQALSLTLADTPSNDSTLNKAPAPSQIRAAQRLILDLYYDGNFN